MHSIKSLLAKYTGFFLGMLGKLGIWGPLVISTADAAALGIPMDPVMIGYAWQERHNFWLVAFYCLTAAMGSAVGSLLPYLIGRAGEELVLLKRVDRRRLEALRDKFEKQEFIFLLVPSMLPPPTPFKLFVLCAGAFEMRIPLFLLAIFLGRLMRFGLSSFLTIRFGPDIVRITMDTARHHLLAAVSVLVLVIVLVVVVSEMRKRRAARA